MQQSVISHLWKNTLFKVLQMVIAPGTQHPDNCRLTVIVFSEKAKQKLWYEAEYSNQLIFESEFEEAVSPAKMILAEIALWEKKLMEEHQNIQSTERSHE